MSTIKNRSGKTGAILTSVEELDNLSGADGRAVAAVDALFHVDNGEEIVNLDCVGGAFALTLAAADAAEVTNLDDLCALILTAAGNDSALALGQQDEARRHADGDAHGSFPSPRTVPKCDDEAQDQDP